MRCPNCGKEMIPQVDSITGKVSKYVLHCDCMPEGMNLLLAESG